MITAMPRIAIAVDDYERAVETFRTAFGLPVRDLSARTVADLGAHVGMCVPPGGSNIELMAPANPDLPLSQALQRFLDRRGVGLYALMLEAPDPNAEADELADRDVEVLPLMAGAGGRDIHPRSTHGVLIRVYPDDSVPPDGGDVTSRLGLSGIDRVMIATTDARKAADAYRHGLGLAVEEPTTDDDRGVLVASCQPPKGGRIELVSPIDADRPFAAAIVDHLDGRGPGMYALVLTADDPDAAVAALGAAGVPGPGGRDLTVFGTRITIDRRS